VFGTRVEVLIWGEPEAVADHAAASVLQEFDRLHQAYHAWQPSQLTALNTAIAAGHPHQVSAELAQLIRDAQSIAAQSDYLFDPGIGTLVKIWGFHDDSFKPRLPDPAALHTLQAAKPSIANLHVNGNAVSSDNPSVALDFGGYLKGVALDRAVAMLRAQGIRNALVNIGGNIIALGSKGAKPWRVGIQAPRGSGAMATLDLRDGEAIGTSGDYQRYFELAGQRYCHLIDPRSGRPAQGTEAVSILIEPGRQAGTLSDAASKPLFIAGTNWRAMAKKTGVDQALRVDTAGHIEVTAALAPRLKFELPDSRVEVVP
jgi:FAD:protein FMN transferase